MKPIVCLRKSRISRIKIRFLGLKATHVKTSKYLKIMVSNKI